MAPFFTIIIPVYNLSSYIRECLDTVISQTFTDWEAICVNDGSTDGSGAILEEYAKRDSRFKVIHKTNAGVSSARNVGKENACGEYCWFVDGDDAIVPSALEIIYGIVCAEQKPDFIRFKLERVLDNRFKNKIRECSLTERSCKRYNTYFSGDDSHWWGFYSHFASAIVGSNAVYKLSLIKDVSFPPFTHGEDALFGFKSLLKAKTAVDLDESLYLCRIREGSAQRGGRSLRRLRNVLGATEERIRISSEAKVAKIHKDRLVSQAVRLLTHDNVGELGGLGEEGLKLWAEAYLRVVSNARYVPKMQRFGVKVLFATLPQLLCCRIILAMPRLRLFLLKNNLVYKINSFVKR